jgi:hypothetical protein
VVGTTRAVGRGSLTIVFWAVLAAPVVARAQVAPSATQLYDEGAALEDQGKCAEALDRLERSIELSWMPTTALRMAHCHEILGQLVEAADDLTSVTTATPPAAASAAFAQAQRDALAELLVLAPRVPKLTLHVVPPDVSGLSVTLDGRTFPVRDLDVPQPTNPGRHTIAATSADHRPYEQQIDLLEGEQRELTVTFVRSASAMGGGNAGSWGTSRAINGAGAVGAGLIYGAVALVAIAAERSPPPRVAFLVGLHGGVALPAGDAPGVPLGLTSTLGPGGGVSAEVAFRFARFFYFGGEGGVTWFGAAPGYGTATSGSVRAVFAVMSSPERYGVYAELGGGYRSLSFISDTIIGTLSGGEAVMGLGIHVKAQFLQIVPKVTVNLGSFGSGAYAFAGFGVTLFYEHGL